MPSPQEIWQNPDEKKRIEILGQADPKWLVDYVNGSQQAVQAYEVAKSHAAVQGWIKPQVPPNGQNKKQE